MSVTGLAQRISTLVAALFAWAFCASLPKMPQRASPDLPPQGVHEIEEATAEWRDEKRDRDVPARWYAPAGLLRSPVVIVSHGIGEDRDSYAYLGRALAASGFLTVHLTHAGTDRAVLEKGYRHLYRAVKQKETWVNRPLDISFVLDQLASDRRADVNRVAVVGHSAGAFTAFVLAGLRLPGGKVYRDRRVKAIVPMSIPRMENVIPPGGFDEVDVPVLNLTGTCDASLLFRTLPRHRRRPFDETRATGHYLVTIRGVNHDTFSSAAGPYHALIASLISTFLRGALLDDPASARWFEEPRACIVKGVELTVERK